MVFNNSSSYTINKVQVLRVWLCILFIMVSLSNSATPSKIQAPSCPCLLRNFGISFRSQLKVVAFFSFFLLSSSNFNAPSRSPLAMVHNTPLSDSSLSGDRDSPGRAVFRQRQCQWLDVLNAMERIETYGDNDQQ